LKLPFIYESDAGNAVSAQRGGDCVIDPLELLQITDGVIGAGFCAREIIDRDGDSALGGLFGRGLRADK
jgi:hypothetical protein